MDIVDIIFDIPEKLVNLTNTLKNFMFAEVNLGTFSVSVWAIVGGVGLVALLIFSIIRG